MRLTSQAFHASYFLPLLKTGVTFAFLQSFVTSPSYNGWSKIIMSDTAVTRASSALVDANQSDYGHRCPLFSYDLIFFHQGYTLLTPSWWKSGFLKASLASKECAKEAFITSASSVSCAIQRPPVSFSNGPRLSLVFPLLPILLSLIPKKILSGLQLSWLQPWMVRQCPCILPRLHVLALTLCTQASSLCITRNYLFIPAGQAPIDSFLPKFLFTGTGLELARMLTSFLGFLSSLFPPGPYHTRLFQADLWSGLTLLSWSPGLWASFLSCSSSSSGCWTPTSHCCYVKSVFSFDTSNKFLLLYEVQQSTSPPSPIYAGRCSHHCTPGPSCIAFADVSKY